MSRGLRSLVVWSVAGAFFAAWWELRGAGAVRGAATSSPAAIFEGENAIDVEAIDRIRLTRRDSAPLELVRENGRWTQTAPFRVDLDEWSARQLAADAAALSEIRSIPASEGDATSLGFAPPMATLVLQGGGISHTLEFGKRGVAGRAFVRSGQGATIHVVDGALYERAVEADPREWRSRSLFPDSAGRPVRITWWTGADGATELVRKSDRWSMLAPKKTRTDAPRIEDLLAALVRSRCDGFLADAPDDLTPFGLAAPVAKLTVTFETEHGESTRTLLVGAPLGVGTGDRYAAIEGSATVMRLGTATQAVLFPRPGTLIEPTGSGVRPADIKRIEVRPKAGAPFELVRDLDRWTAASLVGGTTGPSVPCPAGLPDRLLQQLCVERTPELSIGMFPTDMEAAQVLFFGFDLKPLDVVRIAKDDKTGRWGFENGDGVLRIAPATSALPLTAEEFGVPK